MSLLSAEVVAERAGVEFGQGLGHGSTSLTSRGSEPKNTRQAVGTACPSMKESTNDRRRHSATDVDPVGADSESHRNRLAATAAGGSKRNPERTRVRRGSPYVGAGRG